MCKCATACLSNARRIRLLHWWDHPDAVNQVWWPWLKDSTTQTQAKSYTAVKTSPSWTLNGSNLKCLSYSKSQYCSRVLLKITLFMGVIDLSTQMKNWKLQWMTHVDKHKLQISLMTPNSSRRDTIPLWGSVELNFLEGRNNGLQLPGHFSENLKSSCWTRRRQRWMLRVNTKCKKLWMC